MFSYLRNHGKVAFSIGLVALIAVAVFAPTYAYADDLTRTMDWTMTLTLQGTAGQVPAAAETMAGTKVPVTGDLGLFAAIGLLALAAVAACMLCASRKFARVSDGSAASQDPAFAKRKDEGHDQLSDRAGWLHR